MAHTPAQKSEFNKRVFLLFLPLSMGIAAVFFAFYWYTSNILMDLIKDREKSIVASYNKNIGLDISATIGDLRYLLNQHELANVIERNYKRGEDLESDFLHFSKERGIYDQIRILDDSGQEKVRVNYNSGRPSVTPIDKLQNKANRYYFHEAFELNSGEVFISPLDLNIENGKIEQPLKPMIRIGTPVFDENGKKKGIVLLNYLAGQILESFEQMSQRALGTSMLLNGKGYWLKGENKDDAWGFMYSDRNDDTFANRYPDEWRQLTKTGAGQIHTEQGLFTFETIYPLQTVKQQTSTSEDYFWIIVSRVTPNVISEQSKSERQTLLLAFLVLVVLLLALSIIKARSVIAENIAREAIRQKNESLQHKQSELEAALEEVTESNTALNDTIAQLESALTEIKSLKGILPICSYCKEIRNDEGYWIQLEKYIQTHSDAQFSHSICDACLDEHFPEEDPDE